MVMDALALPPHTGPRAGAFDKWLLPEGLAWNYTQGDDLSAAVVGGDIVSPENNNGQPLQWLISQGVTDYYPGTNQHYCGGTIIAPYWVLTAAHCVSNPNLQRQVWVQAYRHDVSRWPIDTDGAIQVEIADWYIHPDYNGRTFSHDVMLYRLEEPIYLDEYITLDTEGEGVPGTPSKIAGWGSLDAECSIYPDLLHEGDSPVATEESCEATQGRFYEPDNMVCAGYADSTGKVEAGCGDSGGPLFFYRDDGTPVQTGITSWAYGYTYTVYVRVSGVADWIQQTMDANPTAGEESR